MGRSHSKVRKPFERAAHTLEITKRYLRGESQRAIGETLGISRQSVTLAVKQVREAWVTEYLTEWDAHRAKELARIDHLEQEYWEAWERSKKVSNERTQQMKIDEKTGQPFVAGVVMQTDERTGETRYLQGIQWCIDQRCKILGFYAPQRTMAMVSGLDGASVTSTAGGGVQIYLPAKSPVEGEIIDMEVTD